MTAHQDITDALDKLAAHGTADQIAAHLAEQGYGGEQSEPEQCPVANYVRATARAHVDMGPLSWALSGDWGTQGATPEMIGTFIRGFDHGNYPALIKAVES